MSSSIVDAESVMAVEIGAVNTRAALFDVVDSQYHFIAQGIAPSTVNAPYRDASEGIFSALDHLSEVTGRTFVDENARLIIPSLPSGAGVDRLVVTYSAGPELRIVTAGLLEDVSLESARHLTVSSYGKVVDSIGLTDRRKPEAQIDAILAAGPHLLVLTGGTENGASRSVMKLLELIVMALKVMPANHRPRVVYAGNSALAKRIQEVVEKYTKIYVAPNVRPSIDVEDVYPAMEIMNRAVTEVRSGQIGSLDSLATVTTAPPVTVASAFGRMIRFFSQVYDPVKGVLGIDVGAQSTIVAAAVAGKLALEVLPYGVGPGMKTVIKACLLAEITRWLPMHVPASVVEDYLWNKTIYPESVPASAEALAIEQAVVRQLLRLSLQAARPHWPGFSGAFEPILASGAVLSQVASPAQSLMMLLDGLQPSGITTLNLDQNNLIARLGAISKINPILPVQVMETGAILPLATVICPVSSAKYGTPILRVRVEYEQGSETRLEVRQGTLVPLPLQTGQTARITLQPLRDTEIDPRIKRSLSSNLSSFKIVGGVCGAVIDGRGRPLALPVDDARRREMIKKWSMSLGG